MSTISNDTHARIQNGAHIACRRISTGIQATLGTIEQFITIGIGKSLQFIVNIADMLIIILIVLTRAFGRSYTEERSQMRGHRRILLILDELVHLCSHLSSILSGNLTQNNIRNLIISYNLCIKIIGNLTVFGEIREQIAIAHNQNES